MWNFLDEMDKNLLYTYAEVMSGKRKQIQSSKSYTEDRSEHDEIRIAEETRKRAYYLIWFVYRYVLNCETLDEAMKYADEETFRKFHLYSFSTSNSAIYIGTYKEICFRKAEDIPVILEILYNRYDFFEQLECFIRHTKNVRQTRCKQALENYRKMFAEIEARKNED